MFYHIHYIISPACLSVHWWNLAWICLESSLLSALVRSVIGIDDKKLFRASQKSIVLTFGRVCGKNRLFSVWVKSRTVHLRRALEGIDWIKITMVLLLLLTLHWLPLTSLAVRILPSILYFKRCLIIFRYAVNKVDKMVPRGRLSSNPADKNWSSLSLGLLI